MERVKSVLFTLQWRGGILERHRCDNNNLLENTGGTSSTSGNGGTIQNLQDK